MSYIGREPVIGNFVKLDAISVVNGQASYTMQNGGANFTAYETVNQFLVSLNGILQSPTTSFTVSNSVITFASNLVTGDVIDFIIVLGNTLDIGTPSDNTVSLAKLTATGTKDATTFLRGDNTFAVPAGGTNTPAFSATRTSNQSAVSANAITKFQGNVENFDTDSAYDSSTNYRFTPQVAGKYFIYAKFFLDSSDVSSAKQVISAIYKNGSLYSSYQLDFRNNYGGYDNSVINQAIIDMNGSSDYVEAYFQIIVNTGTGLLASGTKSNEFGGYKIIE